VRVSDGLLCEVASSVVCSFLASVASSFHLLTVCIVASGDSSLVPYLSSTWQVCRPLQHENTSYGVAGRAPHGSARK